MRADLNLYQHNNANAFNKNTPAFKHNVLQIVVRKGGKILPTSNDYPSTVNKIMQGMQKSKGYKKFFEKFDVPKIEISDFDGYDPFVEIRIFYPQLKKPAEGKKLTLLDKILKKHINFGEQDYFYLFYRDDYFSAGLRARITSYARIIKNMLYQQSIINEVKAEDAFKNRLQGGYTS